MDNLPQKIDDLWNLSQKVDDLCTISQKYISMEFPMKASIRGFSSHIT
jgi:hypothetical protein